MLREMKRIATELRAYAEVTTGCSMRTGKPLIGPRQAEQVLKRIKSIIEALPAAVKQAHERIIGERQVANDEKILSLFEPDIQVIVAERRARKSSLATGWFWANRSTG